MKPKKIANKCCRLLFTDDGNFPHKLVDLLYGLKRAYKQGDCTVNTANVTDLTTYISIINFKTKAFEYSAKIP